MLVTLTNCDYLLLPWLPLNQHDPLSPLSIHTQTQRRTESDRFLTQDFTPEMYTPEGMAWIENTTMSDILRWGGVCVCVERGVVALLVFD